MSSVADQLNDPNPNVIDASRQYSTDAPVAKHARTCEPIRHKGLLVRETSEQDAAQLGAWLKAAVAKETPNSDPLDEQTKMLINEGARGATDDLRHKAVLGDTTSGGSYTIPEKYEPILERTLLLNGELFPGVTHRTADTDEVKLQTMSNLSLGWGTAEGSQVSLFDTDSLLATSSLTPYDLTGAIEIGRDLQRRSVNDIQSEIIGAYGDRQVTELDKVIATGQNANNQPEGIFQASGLTSVSPDNSTSGPPTVDDYLSLYFTLAKQYRKNPGMRVVFAGTDTSYQRARSIAVSASDQRLVFGHQTNNPQDYSLLGTPFRVQGDIGNSNVAVVCLAKYVLYKVGPTSLQITSEGKELARKHETLIVLRNQWAGKLLNAANTAAKWTTGQS